MGLGRAFPQKRRAGAAAFSVTSIRPSGRNASDHGCSRPFDDLDEAKRVLVRAQGLRERAERQSRGERDQQASEIEVHVSIVWSPRVVGSATRVIAWVFSAHTYATHRTHIARHRIHRRRDGGWCGGRRHSGPPGALRQVVLRRRCFLVAKTTTQASLTSSTLGVGAIIDFEDTFGMDDEKTVPGFMGALEDQPALARRGGVYRVQPQRTRAPTARSSGATGIPDQHGGVVQLRFLGPARLGQLLLLPHEGQGTGRRPRAARRLV